MLASPKLFDITEHIAFEQARINEIIGEYGGGVSRELLRAMTENRRSYKAELSKPIREDGSGPNPALLRQLDDDLDQLLSQGSSQYQVDADFIKATAHLMRLISSRDKHINVERLMITPEKAWTLLTFVEEAITLGLHLLLKIDESDVDDLLQKLDINFEEKLTSAEILKMKTGLHDFQADKQYEILSYISKRFSEIAGSGRV